LAAQSPVLKVAPAGVKSGRWLDPRLTVAAVAVLAGSWFFFVIWKFSVNVLYYDQWDFLTPLFQEDAGFARLFLWQHGPHREGVGLIATQLLYELTGWNARLEVLMIGACVFASMLIALALKRKLFGPLTHSDAAIPLLFLTLAHYEILLGAPNPAYAGFPLLMIMLYCSALLQRNQLLRYGFLLALNFLLIYTGFGVIMGIVTLGVFAVECYRNRRAVALPAAALAIAGISLASFFQNYIFQSAVDCFSLSGSNIARYPPFIAQMFAGYLLIRKPMLLASAVGSAVLIFASAGLAAQYRAAEAPRGQGFSRVMVSGTLLAYSILFAASAAVGRACLGLAASQSSRYSALLIPAFLSLYFSLLAIPASRLRKPARVAFVLLMIPGVVWIPNGARRFADGKRAWAACYLQTRNIDFCDRTTQFTLYPYPERTHLREKLDYLQARGLSLFHR
jgi:hypothetical protein